MSKDNLVGLILCGGLSSRMGEDKGSKLINEQRWSNYIESLFTELGLKTYVSINETQEELYSTFFSSKQLIIDSKLEEVNGPLVGLMAAHKAHPMSHFFVIACDMINLDVETLKVILDTYSSSEELEGTIIPFHDNYLQPLVGIYSNRSLNKISEAFDEGVLANKSMKYILSWTNCIKVEFDGSYAQQFQNFNSPQDLLKSN